MRYNTGFSIEQYPSRTRHKMLDNSDALQAILHRFDTLSERIEAIFGPSPQVSVDYSAKAFRWRTDDGKGTLIPVYNTDNITSAELVGIVLW